MNIVRRELDSKVRDFFFLVLFAAVVFILGIIVFCVVWYCCSRIWGPLDMGSYDGTPLVLQLELYATTHSAAESGKAETAEGGLRVPPTAHFLNEKENGINLCDRCHYLSVPAIVVSAPPATTKG